MLKRKVVNKWKMFFLLCNILFLSGCFTLSVNKHSEIGGPGFSEKTIDFYNKNAWVRSFEIEDEKNPPSYEVIKAFEDIYLFQKVSDDLNYLGGNDFIISGKIKSFNIDKWYDTLLQFLGVIPAAFAQLPTFAINIQCEAQLTLLNAHTLQLIREYKGVVKIKYLGCLIGVIKKIRDTEEERKQQVFEVALDAMRKDLTSLNFFHKKPPKQIIIKKRKLSPIEGKPYIPKKPPRKFTPTAFDPKLDYLSNTILRIDEQIRYYQGLIKQMRQKVFAGKNSEEDWLDILSRYEAILVSLRSKRRRLIASQKGE